MMENYKHTTVLLDEAVNGLNIRPDGIYIDGTFGRGGHSRLILSQLGEEGRLLAIDRDPQAIAVAKTIDDPRFSIIHGPFSALGEYVAERDLIGKIDGILGSGTRAAIQKEQQRLGLPADGWPTRDLLDAL